MRCFVVVMAACTVEVECSSVEQAADIAGTEVNRLHGLLSSLGSAGSPDSCRSFEATVLGSRRVFTESGYPNKTNVRQFNMKGVRRGH
jgi:hypothetical protein